MYFCFIIFFTLSTRSHNQFFDIFNKIVVKTTLSKVHVFVKLVSWVEKKGTKPPLCIEVESFLVIKSYQITLVFPKIFVVVQRKGIRVSFLIEPFNNKQPICNHIITSVFYFPFQQIFSNTVIVDLILRCLLHLMIAVMFSVRYNCTCSF